MIPTRFDKVAGTNLKVGGEWICGRGTVLEYVDHTE